MGETLELKMSVAVLTDIMNRVKQESSMPREEREKAANLYLHDFEIIFTTICLSFLIWV